MDEFSSHKSVPFVDLSSWLNLGESSVQDRQISANNWHDAMTEFGCVILVGHGIDEEVFDAVNKESNSFFNRDLEEKLKYTNGAYGHPSGGYTAPGNEIVALSTTQTNADEAKPKFDPVETFVFTSHPNNFASPAASGSPLTLAATYYERMEIVLKAIHSLSSAALGLSDFHYFEQFYDANIPGNAAMGADGNALKFAHYPPLGADALQVAGRGEVTESDFHSSVRYGAHTDYQGFTILRPDKRDWHLADLQAQHGVVQVLAGGLEVFHRASQQWVQVKIPKHVNALVINAGDFIQRWTNDLWHSPLHRVVTAAAVIDSTALTVDAASDADTSSPVSDSAGLLSRQSIVFFSGPLENCVIECIDPSLMRPEVVGDTKGRKYGPIRSGDHLLLKLNRTNGSEN